MAWDFSNLSKWGAAPAKQEPEKAPAQAEPIAQAVPAAPAARTDYDDYFDRRKQAAVDFYKTMGKGGFGLNSGKKYRSNQNVPEGMFNIDWLDSASEGLNPEKPAEFGKGLYGRYVDDYDLGVKEGLINPDKHRKFNEEQFYNHRQDLLDDLDRGDVNVTEEDLIERKENDTDESEEDSAEQRANKVEKIINDGYTKPMLRTLLSKAQSGRMDLANIDNEINNMEKMYVNKFGPQITSSLRRKLLKKAILNAAKKQQ